MARRNYDAICWNEDFGYYVADATIDTCANCYGPGCFVDQICAAGLSAALGFGYVFDDAGEHEAKARASIARYNRVTMPPFQDLQQHFFAGDTGETVCTYPHGKLANGMQYTNLVSSGFTSPVIAGMVLDRNMKGALEVAA